MTKCKIMTWHTVFYSGLKHNTVKHIGKKHKGNEHSIVTRINQRASKKGYYVLLNLGLITFPITFSVR
jgi:hypothetical protein